MLWPSRHQKGASWYMCVWCPSLSLGANFPANQSLWCPPSLPTNQCPPVCQPIADLSCKEQSGSTLGKPVGFVARPASEQIPMVGRRNTDKAVEQIPTVGRRNTDELIPMWPDSGRQNKPIYFSDQTPFMEIWDNCHQTDTWNLPGTFDGHQNYGSDMFYGLGAWVQPQP